MPIRPRHCALVATVALAACTDDLVCACDPEIASARIHGVVRGPGGVPVPGARVTAQASSAACAAPFSLAGEGVTDADGRFHAEVVQDDSRIAGVCLRAFATPPAGSTLRGSDTVAFAVRLAVEGPLDSARVDLALRAP